MATSRIASWMRSLLKVRLCRSGWMTLRLMLFFFGAGIVQRDIPCILEAFMTFLHTVEERQAELSNWIPTSWEEDRELRRALDMLADITIRTSISSDAVPKILWIHAECFFFFDLQRSKITRSTS
jgi:hypothetical protein